MAPRIQNFSVPAGNGIRIHCDVDPDDGVSLIGANIIWKMYEQEHGVRKEGVDPVLTKVLDDGIEIEDPDLLKFYIDINKADTIDLLRNYYHEGEVISEEGINVTVVYGIATVTQTQNRET